MGGKLKIREIARQTGVSISTVSRVLAGKSNISADSRQRVLDSRQLQALPHGRAARACGIVTQRQRPGTASGVVFVTLEDEHGMVNVVVWAHLASRHRKALLGSTLMGVRGRWEQVDGVSHLIAGHIEDLSPMLGGLRAESRDFH